MSGFKCKGLVLTEEAFGKVFASGGEDMSPIDPDGLLLSKEEDFDALPAYDVMMAKRKDGASLTWEDLTKVCRAWDEAKEHGKAFCCMGSSVSGELQEGV